MAKETKVGLLAGLAFIVCFAIILANRGQLATVPTFEPGFVSEQRARHRQTQRAVDHQQGAASLPRGRGVGTSPPAAPAAYQSLQRSDQPALQTLSDPNAPGSGADVPFQEPIAPRGTMPNSRPREAGREEDSGPRQITDAAPQLAENAPRGASLVAQSPEAQREDLLRELLNRRTDESSASRPEADQDATRIDVSKLNRGNANRAYRVAAGDTLWSIVSKQYGSKSKRHVDAILDANRGMLSNPNEIKSGMTLVLPNLSGSAAAGPDAPREGGQAKKKTDGDKKVDAAPSDSANSKSKEKAARGRDDAGHPRKGEPARAERPEGAAGKDKGFRWYQVRKNDRFASIARSELGDPSRWRELHDLNRDRFPDPDKIREGVRIKIPTDKKSASEARR